MRTHRSILVESAELRARYLRCISQTDDRETSTFVEPDPETEHVARWIPIERLRDGETTFYAPEVLDALER